ncbi:protein-tyrosine phosphatase-like protein [Aspergillus multicolor]|uniref:dual specificity protein phosphatase family protein n=1 Tax=Aspergillus multicolor TaxID=41759 RepID=UPI003CCD04A3
MRWEDLASNSQPAAEPETTNITRKQVELDDDPTEDMLGCLSSMVNFVRNALNRPHPWGRASLPLTTMPVGTGAGIGARTGFVGTEDGISLHLGCLSGTGAPGVSEDLHEGGRVLVHCGKGISRSGAVVVAVIMQTLRVPYKTALDLAQFCRPQISPNIGFEWQLRLWEGCGYNVYIHNMDGDEVTFTRKPSYAQLADTFDRIHDRRDPLEVLRAKEDYLRSLVQMLSVLR